MQLCCSCVTFSCAQHTELRCALHNSGARGRESCRANNTLYKNMLCNDRCNYKVVKWLKPSERQAFQCICQDPLCCIFFISILACWQIGQTYPPTVDFYPESLGEKILSVLETYSNPALSGVDGVIGACARGQHWILNNLCRDRLAIWIWCHCCLSVTKSKSSEHMFQNGRWPRLCTDPCFIRVWFSACECASILKASALPGPCSKW